ncbi:radical SAM protein [candidate division KSB1 bacterium]|nr:radical SAM protein [candidate division KSB1 bacterium]
MANISITSRCNRDCAYCFARSISVETEDMSYQLYVQALEFMKRSKIRQIRLLGGEPTLHPHFTRFVKTALRQDLSLLIFTNGLIKPSLVDFLNTIPIERIFLLVNMQEPQKGEDAVYRKQLAVLKKLGPRAQPGFNLHNHTHRLDFLLDLIDRYHLRRAVRLGLAHPAPGGSQQHLRPKDYVRIGDQVIAFARKAHERQIDIDLDCGFVPCMFPADNLPPSLHLDEIGNRCNPIPDILPDGTVIPCYPLAQTVRHLFLDYSDAQSVQEAFQQILQPFHNLGIFAECADCQALARGLCSGGCRALAMQRLRHHDFAVQVPHRSTRTKSKHPEQHRSRPEAHPPPLIQDGEMPGKRHSTITASGHGSTSGEQERNSLEPEASTADARRKHPTEPWLIPYIDQPPAFWQDLAAEFSPSIRAVYFPIDAKMIGSGRPPQPNKHLQSLLEKRLFKHSLLINPVTMPGPVESIAPAIIDHIAHLHERFGIDDVTFTSLQLAALVKEALPQLKLTASTLMDIAAANQLPMLEGICDAVVPASRIMRNLPALQQLHRSFSGRIRMIVNEACLPGCPYRIQHFYEMSRGRPFPKSLCQELLREKPWLRLTGAWVLPQHLHLFTGIYDELKLAGRVTLQNPQTYRRVLKVYITRQPLMPHEIGGGPASVLQPMIIEEDFYLKTLHCGGQCAGCDICPQYYEKAIRHSAVVGASHD